MSPHCRFYPQVDNMIHFHQDEVLLQWDAQIQAICNKVNGIIDDVTTAGLLKAVTAG
jgi:hypothetical protein